MPSIRCKSLAKSKKMKKDLKRITKNKTFFK